jgi:hypothetical protein
MAFDLYLGRRKVSIDTLEEEIFHIVNNDARFPRLNWLWEEFYNSPSITPKQANDIVHELILLRSIHTSYSVKKVIDKLLPYFSLAFKDDITITTLSD